MTLQQIVRKPRKAEKEKSKSPALTGKPQRRGICEKLVIRTPKKPNSAQRRGARIKLFKGPTVTCHIPGEGHNLQEHGIVLIRGGRTKDLPGVKYKCVRGKYDLGPVVGRCQARSKYGLKSTNK